MEVFPLLSVDAYIKLHHTSRCNNNAAVFWGLCLVAIFLGITQRSWSSPHAEDPQKACAPQRPLKCVLNVFSETLCTGTRRRSHVKSLNMNSHKRPQLPFFPFHPSFAEEFTSDLMPTLSTARGSWAEQCVSCVWYTLVPQRSVRSAPLNHSPTAAGWSQAVGSRARDCRHYCALGKDRDRSPACPNPKCNHAAAFAVSLLQI